MSLPQPLAILLTPSGRGAIAAVLVTGRDAVGLVDQLFVPANGRSLSERLPPTIAYGRWSHPSGEEVIVVRRQSPRLVGRSPADQYVEIHCHGGSTAVQAVLTALQSRGCGTMDWRTWLADTAIDPVRAAAHVALAEAATRRTAAILLDQFQGAFSRAIHQLLANLEAGAQPDVTEAGLDRLLQWAELGAHLTRPWLTVIAGPPNVGKSTLINTLTGYERAIVCDMPGTTRDIVTSVTAVQGWPVELADTAGLCATDDDVEKQGVQRAETLIGKADLVVLVSEALWFSRQSPAGNAPLGGKAVTAIWEATRTIHVVNKIDQLADDELPRVRAALEREIEHGTLPTGQLVLTSATSDVGVKELLAAIKQALVPAEPSPEAAIPFLPSQVEALSQARAAIQMNQSARGQSILQQLVQREAVG